jgi:hypothetical protein
MSGRLFPDHLKVGPTLDPSAARPFLCDDCGQKVESFEIDPADGYVDIPTTHLVFSDRSLTLRPCGHTNGATVSP